MISGSGHGGSREDRSLISWNVLLAIAISPLHTVCDTRTVMLKRGACVLSRSRLEIELDELVWPSPKHRDGIKKHAYFDDPPFTNSVSHFCRQCH